jgi:transposase
MFSKVKTEERELARELRRQEGASIKDIARRLGVSVSSVSVWVRDIELTSSSTRRSYTATRPTTGSSAARFLVDFLKKHFDLTGDQIRITCHLYADHLEKQAEVEQYWLSRLGLPPESLRKSVVNVYSKYSKRKRSGNLPFGTCHLVVSRTGVTQTIFGAIQEIGGFTRESWLE